MSLDRGFFTSPTGQVLLVAAVLLIAGFVVRWQHGTKTVPTLPSAKPSPAVPLPKVLTREGVKLLKPSAPTVAAAPVAPIPSAPPPAAAPLPLGLFATPSESTRLPPPPTAPYGRLIPCRTVLALESNRLETPIIGLVTEPVWHDGQCVVPAGAEVHGRAALDRARERIAGQGRWQIVWRTTDADNGTELSIDGLVLDREVDATAGVFGEHDGSAGLRGEIVRTGDQRELKLFAATFLASATAALQDTRVTGGLLGEAALPAATVRNGVLAGSGTLLREYAQQIREAVAKDGFYLRVPAGTPFYLYVTQTLDRNQARHTPTTASLTP